MSDFGFFSSRFHDGTKSLRHFDEALRYFKQSSRSSAETFEQIQKLMVVLKPVADILKGRLPSAIEVDEFNIIEFLQQKNAKEWQRYREKIIQLSEKLASYDTTITKNEFDILNDVADAIDKQCAYLFRKISGRA